MATLIEEVSEWKLEAKLESSKRYFYHTTAVDRLAQGKRSFVIGRKGTGKTAICEYLAAIERPFCFAQKLTFKNFPFNKLYEQSDSGYTAPNQYITIWKYLIYATACRLLAKSPRVDVETREELARLFDLDVSHALPSAVQKWTDVKFELKVLGTGGAWQGKRDGVAQAPVGLGDKVEFLETYVHNRIGTETFLILFDELDEDYKDIVTREKYTKYTELLTSLFKAVQDIRSKFRDRKLFPIIFLRDDIYDILQDADKTKWSDYKIELSWDKESIKNLLSFRISRAGDPLAGTKLWQQAWPNLYAGGDVPYGDRQQRRMSAFDYITRSTQLRPRDYIRYLQVCAEQAIEEGRQKITSSIIRSEDKSFSNYLRSELEDEIHAIIPEIGKIFNLFSKLRKQTLTIGEFNSLHLELVNRGDVPTKDTQFILEVLFLFSVIGNAPRQRNTQVFRYMNKDARLNMSEPICIHRGLFKSLQVL